MAWTWNDFVEFLTQTKDAQTDTDLKNAGTYLINNRTYVENTLTGLGVDVSNYSSFFIKPPVSSLVAFDLYMYTKDNNYGSWTVSGSDNLTFSSFNTAAVKAQIWLPNYNSNKSAETLNNNQMGKTWGLLDTAPSGSYGNLLLQNAYNKIVLSDISSLDAGELPWTIATGRIGDKYSGSNYSYHLYDSFDEELTITETTRVADNGGQVSNLQITTTLGLLNGSQYYLTLEDSGGTQIIKTSNFTLSWTGGEPQKFLDYSGLYYYNKKLRKAVLDNYSTTEQRVGTWIDGKPIYKVTIQTTTPTPPSTSSARTTEVNISSYNIDKVVNIQGFLLSSYGSSIPLPVIDGETYSTYTVIKAHCSPSTLTITSNNTSRSGTTTYVTIYYTKTTDNDS